MRSVERVDLIISIIDQTLDEYERTWWGPYASSQARAQANDVTDDRSSVVGAG
jgi:hypothetical protein